MHTRKLLAKVFYLIVLFTFPLLALAQPGFDDGVEDVPIDGGLSLLIAAGAGYAIRKTRKQQQMKH